MQEKMEIEKKQKEKQERKVVTSMSLHF